SMTHKSAAGMPFVTLPMREQGEVPLLPQPADVVNAGVGSFAFGCRPAEPKRATDVPTVAGDEEPAIVLGQRVADGPFERRELVRRRRPELVVDRIKELVNRHASLDG